MMKILFSPFLLTVLVLCPDCSPAPPAPVENGLHIQVDLTRHTGPMHHAWAMFGYDEPNYTYMKNGKKLLTEISELSPVPVYVRTHNLLNTGEGTHALKWGSTNAYTEDENGNPVYDWTITDRIFDTYVEMGIKPLVEIGFMPKDLSVNPDPYQHSWRPGAPYEEIYTGWAYPPNDYEKWGELVYQWVSHCVERYGKEEVETWFWELWNEPNIGYWQGTLEEYIKLYDYTAHAVKRALPTANMGGPHTTGPSWKPAERYLRGFLDHIVSGTNHVTGETGAPLDFIAFHAKGAPRLRDSIILMNMGTQLRDVSRGFEVVASYPTLKDLPVIIGECDPEGCAACSMQDYPENAYRNGTMYSSYTAASFPRIYELADHFGINLRGIVTWAFEFEDQPWFNGYRDLATNGVDKPVLNVFRMFGMMEGRRVKVTGDPAYDCFTVRDSSVRGKRDVNAFAATTEGKATVMLWNYHDLNVPGESVWVNLETTGLDTKTVRVSHYRIDRKHSNAYELWKEMGSPQEPDPSQVKELEEAGQLHLLGNPVQYRVNGESLTLPLELPGQAVSLIVLEWYD